MFIEQQVLGLRAIGVEVVVRLLERRRRGMRVYWGLGRRATEWVRAERPDLVHVMYGGVMAGAITESIHTVPTVVTFHGSDLLGENFSGPLRKVVSRYGVWRSYAAAARASGVVVVSERLRRVLPRRVAESGTTTVIPCGIDLDRFRPLDRDECCDLLGWDRRRFHVLFQFGSGDPVKRPWLARHAVELLRAEGIDAELHLASGIKNSDMPIHINAANCVLLTSAHEGSPTIVKEALACNVPVVSVDVGDVAERIDGVRGCYITGSDPAALADGLRRVAEGPQRTDGRARVESLSLGRVARRLRDFYESII